MAGLIKCDIAVIGAGGDRGSTIAHRLALEGREVVLIDPDDAGYGCILVAMQARWPITRCSRLARLRF